MSKIFHLPKGTPKEFTFNLVFVCHLFNFHLNWKTNLFCKKFAWLFCFSFCLRLEMSAYRSQFTLHIKQRRVFELTCIQCGGFVSFQFSQPSMTRHFSLAAMRQVENTIVNLSPVKCRSCLLHCNCNKHHWGRSETTKTRQFMSGLFPALYMNVFSVLVFS